MLFYRSRKCTHKITDCIDDRMTVQSAELRATPEIPYIQTQSYSKVELPLHPAPDLEK